ncbi:hypothetical protein F4X10_00955 [Candidatus Poribacteria bacterium]|nr:hypothetical protein [Candidatus Poribacteria bacterium]
MKMLRLFLIIMLVLYASAPVFAELSVEDLEKIRQIVNESEVRLGERIDDVKKELDTRIEDQGKRITDLRDRINFQGHLIIALIVAIIGFVAVPLSSLVYQYSK